MSKQKMTIYLYYGLAVVLVLLAISSFANKEIVTGISELIFAGLSAFVGFGRQNDTTETEVKSQAIDTVENGLLIAFGVLIILYFVLPHQLILGVIAMVCLIIWAILMLIQIVIGLVKRH